MFIGVFVACVLVGGIIFYCVHSATVENVEVRLKQLKEDRYAIEDALRWVQLFRNGSREERVQVLDAFELDPRFTGVPRYKNRDNPNLWLCFDTIIYVVFSVGKPLPLPLSPDDIACWKELIRKRELEAKEKAKEKAAADALHATDELIMKMNSAVKERGELIDFAGKCESIWRKNKALSEYYKRGSFWIKGCSKPIY